MVNVSDSNVLDDAAGNTDAGSDTKAVEAVSLSHWLPSTTVERYGRVVQAIGTSIRVTGINARIGQRCLLRDPDTANELLADVVGIEGGELILYPLGTLSGISLNSTVQLIPSAHQIPFSNALLGRVLDGFGKPLDQQPVETTQSLLPLEADAPSPLARKVVDKVFATGIRCIDSLLTTGVGQRMGIFASAGCGKSTLLSMLSNSQAADVVVLALVGERGREVGEFLQLFSESTNREKVVVVVATSDRPAMERVHAAKTATALAEGYRAEGKNVLLLMDSVTRYARALREIGLSVGEPPVRRGFPPSVFTELPKLFERTGNDAHGSITAFYTVLVEDEENSDPITEEVRSILDGHIVLTSKLGETGHYPAIDVLASKSRLYTALADKDQQQAARKIRQLLAKYKDIEFLIHMGEYEAGADAMVDEAVNKHDSINAFLCQSHTDTIDLQQTLTELQTVCGASR